MSFLEPCIENANDMLKEAINLLEDEKFHNGAVMWLLYIAQEMIEKEMSDP